MNIFKEYMEQKDFDFAYENATEEEPYQRVVGVAEGHGISMLNSQAYDILRKVYGEDVDYEVISDSVSVMTDNQIFEIIKNFVKSNSKRQLLSN